MNLFGISGLIVFVASFFLSLIVIRYGRTRLHKIWLFFNLAVGECGFCAYKIGFNNNQAESLHWFKLSHIGVILIPVFLFHSICDFCNDDKKKSLVFVYSQATLFLFFNFFTKMFIVDTRYMFSSFYYAKVGGAYHFFFIT